MDEFLRKRFGGSMKDSAIVSCGGVVIYRNKVLVLYKNRNGRHKGWVLPKGSLEPEETLKQAALREVKEESGVSAYLQKYLGKTEYSFKSTVGKGFAKSNLGKAFFDRSTFDKSNFDKSTFDKTVPVGRLETIRKTVYWYLMTTNSFDCKPQVEEYFMDVGFYKQHEAYHLLKYDDERQIMRRAFIEQGKINSEKRNTLKNMERTNAE